MSEIIQRVVEKIEIQGDKEAVSGLDRVAGSAQSSNKVFEDFIMTIAEMNDRMSAATKALEKTGDTSQAVGEKVEQGGNKGSKGMSGLFKTMFKANIAAMAVEKAIGFVVGNLSRLASTGWESAKAIDGATGRVQGLTLALFELDEQDPMERFAKSGRVASAVVRRLQDDAYDTSTPFRVLEHSVAESAGSLSGLGIGMERILDLSRKNAAAAKVFGDDASSSIVAINAAVQSGALAGKKGLPAALKAMVGDLSKLKPEERLQKIEDALGKLGAPLALVTQGPEEGFDRLGQMAERYLGALVLPLYDRLGAAAGRVSEWLKEGDKWWKQTAADAEDIVYSAFQLAEGVWAGVNAVYGVLAGVGMVEEKLGVVWEIGKGLFSVVELIGLGWKAGAEVIQVLSDPNRGMGKLYTYSEAISLKWNEIVDKILLVAEKMAKIAVPDWIKKKVPGIGNFFEGFAELNKERAAQREKQGKRLAIMESKNGLDPLTNETRRLRRAALDDAKGLLGGLKGNKIKVEQNIGKIEIVQDFRNQDPDRVLVEFVNGLERLGEAAIQSTVGGQATVYEGGL